ncbi:MAG: hypothetical protein ACJ8ER_14000 [Allosphingosinicella sp.]
MIRISTRRGLAAAALLVATAGAGAAFAHPHSDGDGKKVERVIIIQDDKDGDHASADGAQIRRFEIHRDGDHASADGGGIRRMEMVGDCRGGDKIVDESAGDDKKKTRVMICSRGEPSARAAEHLEEALARINANDDLSAEQKAKIETALRSAIERARAAH